MKLATFRDGTRDGTLVVVSRDLAKAVRAESAVAGLHTLQQLLDDWQTTQLKLARIYAELNEAVDGTRSAPFEIVDFDAARCTAPLRLAELRTVETILEGKPRTPFLKFGDRVRVEMLDEAGRSIFGAIDQQVVRYSK